MNFDPFPPREKSEFVKAGIRIRVMDTNIKNQFLVIGLKSELRNIICQGL